jgi:hypothetical protein
MTLRNHTMRDLISKLDAIVSETALNPKDPQGDYDAKSKALQDLQLDPNVADDPQLSNAVIQRKADLEKEAARMGIKEDLFQIGDDFGISFSEDGEIATEITDILEDGIVIDLDDTALEMLAAQGAVFLEGELVEDKQKGVDGKACWKGYKRMGTKQKGGKTVDNCVKMEDHGPENPDAAVNYGEYDREGDMAKDDLRTINSAAKELYAILDADENLPEWVQAKITKAVDYIDTVRDYMKANKYEEDVQTDEAKYQGREVPLGKKMAGDVKKSKVYVRKPNGNIVKVNFGDKKMRIKKSNPARRKSFRARHNCKNPGPRWKARYWSCRSW